MSKSTNKPTNKPTRKGEHRQATPWKASSGAPNPKRPWWVSRCLEGPGVWGESAKDKAGRIRTFATQAAAESHATSLNKPAAIAAIRFRRAATLDTSRQRAVQCCTRVRPPVRAAEAYNLPLVPRVVAETVAAEVYTDEARFNDRNPRIVEAARQRLTAAQVREFVEASDARCRAAWEVKAGWLVGIMRSKSNRGRDKLYAFMRHWFCAFVCEKFQIPSGNFWEGKLWE